MSGSDAPRVGPGRPSGREWALLAGILLVGAALRFDRLSVGYLNIHAARDYFRALQMLHGEAFHPAGAEMLYGGRTVGWFYYLLLSVPLTLSPSPIAVMTWLAALSTASLVLCHVAVRRFFGVATALGVTALFAVAPANLIMMRNMWNPAFLPVFNVAALLFLLMWRAEGRRWAVGAYLVVWGLAFQIHFSVYIHLIALLALRPWRRDRRPGWGPVVAALLALAPFWWPYLAHEITTDWSNARAVTARPEEQTGFLQGTARGLFQTRLNPTAVPQLERHLRVDLTESTTFTVTSGAGSGEIAHTGIEAPHPTNFIHFMDVLSESRPAWLLPVMIVDHLSWIQVGLFGLGLLTLLLILLSWPRGLASRLRGLFVHGESAWDIALVLIVWLGVSLAPLAFLEFEGYPYRRVVPGRYFQVWYPLQFLVMILGLRAVFFIAPPVWRATRASPLWARQLGWVAGGLIGLLFVTQAALMLLWYEVKADTGVAFYYTGLRGREIFNVGDKVRLAEVLVRERGMTLKSFRERTGTDNIYQIHGNNEETFDYELRAQPGFTTRADSSPEVHFHIMDREDGAFPHTDEQVEILHTDDVGRLRAITFRITDPKLVIPAQLLENNYVW